MKKNVLMSSLAGIFVGVGALLAGPGVEANAPAAVMDACSKDLLLSYFPEQFVNDTLKRFNIPEDKWTSINVSLSATDKEIVKLVEQKAAAMTPNPLKDPQQRQAAVKLFRDTLLQVFTDALKSNGVQDVSQFQAMLDDIQQQKAKKFAQCMETQRSELKQKQSQIVENEDVSDQKDNQSHDEDSDDEESDVENDDDRNDDEN